jgi:hypothetical protein
MVSNSDKFWAQASLEPKRQHRWVLLMNDIPAYTIKSVGKPSLQVNTTTHKYFGHTFKYPGATEWQNIQVTLVDPIEPDTSGLLMDTLNEAGYRDPNRRLGVNSNGLFTLSKEQSVRALGEIVRLQQIGDLNGMPNQVIETWELWNPWIQSFQFGELNYESDAMVTVTLTLAYDWARHLGPGQS